MNFTLRSIENCYSEYKLTIIGFKEFVDSKFNGVIEFRYHKIPLILVSYIDRRTNDIINLGVDSVYVTNVNELKVCGRTINGSEHEVSYGELDMCDVLFIIKDILNHIGNNGTKAKEELFNALVNDTDYNDCANNQSHFSEMLKEWLSGVRLSDYILDKKYMDISWIVADGTIYDNDSLWDDWKSFNEQ